MRSVLALMRTDLEAPDHTTLSHRSQHLDLALDRIPAQGRSAARWVPVGDGLTHKLTDLRSWLLNCRSSSVGD